MHNRSIALTIAGSDSSGGAGIQTDLRVFSAFGIHGLTVPTCLVAETHDQVLRVDPVSTDSLSETLDLLADNYQIDVLKIGLIPSKAHLDVIYDWLQKNSLAPVVDPVMIASTEQPLTSCRAEDLTNLLRMSRLVTPNLPEGIALLASKSNLEGEESSSLAQALFEKFRCPILLKGGHESAEKTQAVDYLVQESGMQTFSADRVRGVNLHGTGCAYSAAITALLAKGFKLEKAIQQAKHFIQKAISTSYPLARKSNLHPYQALNLFATPDNE